MTPDEIEQAVISNIRENKDQEIPKLKACLSSSNADSKEKAYCADKLGIIYNFIDDDLNSKTQSIKYFHIAYKLSPNNATYADNACLHTFNSIIKYSTIAVASKKEADFLLSNFDLMAKCADYIFPWFKPGKDLGKEFMVAGAASNLGKFYYKNAQMKDDLTQAKKFFKIAYESETYLKVSHGGNLAAAHYKLGEIQEAAHLYEECLVTEITEDFPKTEKANCAGALSLIALETKAFKQALSFSKIAHKLDPDNGYYLHNLASSYFATKQYDKAKHYFEKCTGAELTDQFAEGARDSCYHGLELIGSLNTDL